MRRRFGLAMITVLVVLAGCNGGPGARTPQSIEADASRTMVGTAALSETGFTEARVDRVTVKRSGTLRIAGDVQMNLGYRVNATGWRALYRSSDGQRVVGVYTVPQAKPDRVATTIDPLGDRSLATIVDVAQGTYADTSDLQHVRNRTVTVFDRESTVQQYAGSATADGESTGVTVYVATVEHDGDIIRAVAVGPVDTYEWATVRPLFRGLQR